MSADAIVKSFIDRILRLKEEQDTLAADIREVYAEAKGNGYDKTAMGQLVAHLRKVEKVGISAVQEGQSIFDLYLEAYERASSQTYAPARTREIIEEFDAETGEITEHEQPETASQSATNEGESDAKSADQPACKKLDLIDGRRQDAAGAESQPSIPHQNAPTESAADAISAPHSPSAAPPADAVAVAPQPSQAATAAIPEGIPAFLVKESKPLRPNCLNPENCAGYGSHTCHRCTQAMAESEIAA